MRTYCRIFEIQTETFMARIINLLLLVVIFQTASAQTKSPLISGPWTGNVQLRNATIWLEVAPSVKSVMVKYKSAGQPEKSVSFKGSLGNDFNPVKIELNGLMFNSTYQYSIWLDGKEVRIPFPTRFTTLDLWQWRKPAPDFSFLTGSCAYFNESLFDRPGKPYGGDSSIFETMAKSGADFNIWLGDNWYTREVDYNTVWGLNYRASHDRAIPVLQQFMASMPQYSIWDDHDFGPNDAGKNYLLKDDSRRIFMNYSCNPAYGEDGKGIYSLYSYSDVDFFLTDDRYFRADNHLPDSLHGQANAEKTYFGRAQMEWLKNALLYSHATFKIIVTGSQVLNPLNTFECMQQYKGEYQELMNFLSDHQIPGVVFLTGDRHHSEVIELKRPNGLYPLYDITSSPLTSGVAKARGVEADNPYRVSNTLVELQNFSKISVTGKKNERVLQVLFLGIKGDKLAEWKVSEADLKVTKKPN